MKSEKETGGQCQRQHWPLDVVFMPPRERSKTASIPCDTSRIYARVIARVNRVG